MRGLLNRRSDGGRASQLNKGQRGGVGCGTISMNFDVVFSEFENVFCCCLAKICFRFLETLAVVKKEM